MKLSVIVVFDFMGVVFTQRSLTKRLYSMIPTPLCSLDELKKFYIKYSLSDIGGPEFWSKIVDGDYSELERKYLDSYTLDPDFNSTADYLLGGGFVLAVMSNHPSKWASYLIEKHSLNRIFKHIIISGDIGVRKPDLRMYAKFFSELGFRGNGREGVYLIDDRLENLESAANMGFKTIYYIKESETRKYTPDHTIRRLGDLKNIFC